LIERRHWNRKEKLLAQARLTAFAESDSSQSEARAKLALTPGTRQPSRIHSDIVETHVIDVGDLAPPVLATLPFGSGTTTVPAVFRTATIEDEPYHVFTFGKG